jgi:hypothetical protein
VGEERVSVHVELAGVCLASRAAEGVDRRTYLNLLESHQRSSMATQPAHGRPPAIQPVHNGPGQTGRPEYVAPDASSNSAAAHSASASSTSREAWTRRSNSGMR